MVAPIELSLRVKGEKELKRTKQLIDQVEKTIGKLNKVKITFNTSEAERSLDKLTAQLQEADAITKRFFGSNTIRSGIGAFAAKTGEARQEVQALRASLQGAKTDSDRTSKALQVLSGQFKVARLEGQAFARASEDFFKFEGAGSLQTRLDEIADFPKTLAASAEALKELTFMQSMAIAGTDEFLAVNAALGRQLEFNAGLLERAARAQKPFGAGMSMVPPGLQRPALPAAGETSGTRQLTTDAQKTAVAFVQAATASQDFAENLSKAATDAATLPPIFNVVSKSLKTVSKSTQQATVKAKKQRRQSIISSALIGGGFPLLFGGGPGAAIGGGIGGGIGGAIGGAFGFAGGIVGTAIGQALDQAAEGANLFAKEATKASTSIGRLVEAFGLRGTGAAQAFNFAETLGIGSAARQAAEGSLETIVGKDGLGNLEKLAQSSEDASNALDRFGAATTSFFAPLLTAVNQGVAGLFGGISPLEQQRRDQEALENLPTRGRGTAARRNRLTARIAETSASPEAKAQLKLEEKITAVVDARKQLAADSARVEGIRLTARRDSLAFEQGTLKVQAEQNKLDVLAIQRQAEKNEAKQRELDLQINLTEAAKRQAENARRNAVIEARRQIQREQISGAANQIRAIRREQRLELEYQQTREGRFTLFEKELKQIDAEFVSNGLTLDLERKRALIGVTEEERISSINRDYDLKVRLLEKQLQIDKQRAQQQYAEYRLGRLQVAQALDLQRVQAQAEAQRKIRETSPFARESFLTDPFFGSSRELAANQAANFDQQVAMMRFGLGQAEEQLAQATADQAAPARIKALEDQRAKLELSLATYREFTPAVDEAALAQARFSDALAITTPVTDSLFDSLVSVVEGTKTAEQAFADFLRSIASMLMDAAKQMIATYIAIGIARMFAGMPAKSGPAPDIQQGTGALKGEQIMIGGMRTAASGKGTLMNQPYLVGERGPELFVPRNNGTIVPNHQMSTGANVTVNVDASGSSAQGNGQQAKALGQAIGAAVQAEIVKQKRPGGLLS